MHSIVANGGLTGLGVLRRHNWCLRPVLQRKTVSGSLAGDLTHRVSSRTFLCSRYEPMNIVRRIVVEGFWYDKTVDMSFYEDVNFIIGPNGSGKTTVINLLAAALRGDFEALVRIPFTRVLVQLKEKPGRGRPWIEVTKSDEDLSRVPSIRYKISRSRRETPEEFNLDGMALRRDLSLYYQSPRSLRHRPPASMELQPKIAELIKTTWLSVHRASVFKRGREEESLDSTVDLKVNDISESFTKLFSGLQSAADNETQNFLEYVFISLLTSPVTENKISMPVNIDSHYASLISIFQKFNVKESKYKPRLARHFDAVRRGASISKDSTERQTANWVFSLIDHSRIQKIVEQWESLQEKLKAIYAPRDNFLDILNSMLVRKEIQFSERNEAQVKTQSGKIFPLEYLSSGEKQVYIFLGEVTLQEGMPHVFIADEPELSLHVKWQSELVANLKRLNPTLQIIVATHSPDIVSKFQNRIVKIEGCIS